MLICTSVAQPEPLPGRRFNVNRFLTQLVVAGMPPVAPGVIGFWTLLDREGLCALLVPFPPLERRRAVVGVVPDLGSGAGPGIVGLLRAPVRRDTGTA